MTTAWEPRATPDVAFDRILDAAGRCFAATSIRATSIGDVAEEAGCSRPTVYRYFASRDALRVAFIRREARRLGARIRRRIDVTAPPEQWVVEAVMAAVRGVRRDPSLSAWFTPDDVGTTLAAAMSPDVIDDLAAALVDTADDGPASLPSDAGRWTVRIILSLLATPEPSDAIERRLVERFLVPVLV